mgnify:CR=1 FL=1
MNRNTNVPEECVKEPIMKAVQKLLEEQVSASGSHVTGGGTTPPGRNVQNRRASLAANPVEPIAYPVTNNRQPLLLSTAVFRYRMIAHGGHVGKIKNRVGALCETMS